MSQDAAFYLDPLRDIYEACLATLWVPGLAEALD